MKQYANVFHDISTAVSSENPHTGPDVDTFFAVPFSVIFFYKQPLARVEILVSGTKTFKEKKRLPGG